MTAKGEGTRTAIMDAAEGLIMEQGFSASSVDRVIERAGVHKGTFFYHFKTKADLAQALVERYAARDAEHLVSTLARADALARDPLQQLFIFVGLLREEAAALTEPFAGCLYASFLYEAQLFDARTHETIRAGFEHWRDVLGRRLAAVMARHSPRLPTTPEALADMSLALFEGAFILSKTLRDPQAIATQLDQFRNYLELLFAPPERENASTGT
jgi:TetR/AcrR family transcriptional repressor of nem operon